MVLRCHERPVEYITHLNKFLRGIISLLTKFCRVPYSTILNNLSRVSDPLTKFMWGIIPLWTNFYCVSDPSLQGVSVRRDPSLKFLWGMSMPMFVSLSLSVSVYLLMSLSLFMQCFWGWGNYSGNRQGIYKWYKVNRVYWWRGNWIKLFRYKKNGGKQISTVIVSQEKRPHGDRYQDVMIPSAYYKIWKNRMEHLRVHDAHI